MENNLKIAPDMWTKLDKSEKDAEKVSRKSLTFWQDAARRLKQNKVAMVSLVVIVVIIAACVIVPVFYPLQYMDQNLDFGNIPLRLDIYKVGDSYFYMNGEYKLIDITPEGVLLKAHPMKKDDVNNKRYIYDFDGTEVIVDYNPYFEAVKKFNALEKKAKKDPSIDLIAAQHELDTTQKVTILKKEKKYSLLTMFTTRHISGEQTHLEGTYS
jgi:oligopeptide transport system permease protein